MIHTAISQCMRMAVIDKYQKGIQRKYVMSRNRNTQKMKNVLNEFVKKVNSKQIPSILSEICCLNLARKISHVMGRRTVQKIIEIKIQENLYYNEPRKQY